MTGRKKPKAVSKADWDAVAVPALTEAQLRGLKPAADVLPGLVAAYRKGRGKQKAPTKQQVTLRLDRDVVEHFKRGGAGWQTRINSALKSVVTHENGHPRSRVAGTGEPSPNKKTAARSAS